MADARIPPLAQLARRTWALGLGLAWVATLPARGTTPGRGPMLEQPLIGAPADELVIHEFDLTQKTYTKRRWIYQLDPRATAIGDLQLDDAGRALVIERDPSEAKLSGYKTIHRALLGPPGPIRDKQLLVDLLAIADPHRLAPAAASDIGVGGERFALPFVTIESLLALPGERLLVLNDNNYPFGRGRHPGSDAPDDSELVLLQLPRAPDD